MERPVAACVLHLLLPMALLWFAGQDPLPDDAPPTKAPPSHVVLRASLDAMREGKPGEPKFDAAITHLPALIRSRSGWWVSGGAWLAGEHGRDECLPDLLDALEHENQRPANHTPEMKGHILDALIRLGSDVPTERLIERFDESLLAETYLLLARAEKPDLHAVQKLMAAAPREHGPHWAAAFLLAHHNASGLAKSLVADVGLSITICVNDPDGAEFEWSETWGRSYNSTSHSRWPPRIEWDVLPPAPGKPFLQVSSTRQSHPRKFRGPKRLAPDEQLALRGRLLDHLMGECDERGLIGERVRHDLVWTTAEAYDSALRTHLEDPRRQLLRVATRLEKLGKLQDARKLVERVTVFVEIQDHRSDKVRDPLPKPPDLPMVRYVK